MKKLILPMLAFIAYTSNAQLSLLPQIGIEASGTKIKSSDFSSFSPAGILFTPRLSLRMAYKLKGQSVFVGVATSPSVEFTFTDPQTAATSFTTAKNMRLRFEGGYQFSTKPITLRKPVFATIFAGRPAHRLGGGEQRGYGRCGMRKSAGSNSISSYKTIEKVKGLYMRIKPSIGLALAPSSGEIETETKAGQTTYEYNAGLNTAVIAGAAFEFGTRNKTDLVVSLNYVKGIGNNSEILTTGTIVKPVTTTFTSRTSGFNLSVGMPITFKKTKVAMQHPQCTRSTYRGQCGRYKI